MKISSPNCPLPGAGWLRTLGLGLGLILLTLAVYWPVGGYAFLSYDDNLYVTANPQVSSGLHWANLKWAFTTSWGNNWIPLTWLSHMLDCTLLGLAGGRHHLVNLFAHLGNTLLLFLLLRRFTRQDYPAALVAALFAIHPLHVESVAWIAERKDLLSTGLGVIAIWFYGNYVARPSLWRYLLVVISFILALMAKPMLVTLPFLLLLLDYWPLARFPSHGARRIVAEKIPLLLLAIVVSYITYRVQTATGAVATWENYPLAVRASNGVVSYLLYLVKMLWPTGLAVIYPHPGQIQGGLTIIATLLLLALTGVAIRGRIRFPYLFTGWFWYLGSLVPVIGLVQAGNQARADRYTYLPLVGIFIIVAWGGRELATVWPGLKRWLAGLAAVAILLLAATASRQLQVWASQKSLFQHTLAVTGPNAMAEFQYGTALVEEKQLEEAGRHLRRAIALAPEFAKAHHNLAYLLEKQGKVTEALVHYQKAVELAPGDGEGHYNLGLLLMRQWQLEEAIVHLQAAARLNPGFAKAGENLARAQRLQQASGGKR